MTTNLFVFGTLKEGFPNFSMNGGRRLPGVYRTRQRYPLYLVGERCSPWLINTPGIGHHVLGQLFELEIGALGNMDRLERVDTPDGYRRQEIEVERVDQGVTHKLRADAYLKDVRLLEGQLRSELLTEYTPAHAVSYRRRDSMTFE